MKKTWQTWTIFTFCVIVFLGAMGWISVTVIQLDYSERQTRRHSIEEENIRLALWRMDSVLSNFLSQENSRPYFLYASFYPAQRAYIHMFAEIRDWEKLTESPLLSFKSPYILLHFQLNPNNEISSPQVPMKRIRRIPKHRYYKRLSKAKKLLKKFDDLITPNDLFKASDKKIDNEIYEEPLNHYNKNDIQQEVKSQIEWNKRATNYKNSMQQKISNEFIQSTIKIDEGTLKPVWINGLLLLLRRVYIGDKLYIQGCWIDWKNLKQKLIEEVKDLLPNADLTHVNVMEDKRKIRILAALPLKLLPGTIKIPEKSTTSPIKLSLYIACFCVFIATLFVGIILKEVMTLSERRGAFVSAVTHELRTPLTTFRMYTEMLLNGMIADKEKQKKYLQILYTQSERLAYLVENVLAYAKLEKKHAVDRKEIIEIEELIEKIKTRLLEHSKQNDMELMIHIENNTEKVCVDTSAIEQILFNLVDNACKYAASGKKIYLSAFRKRKCIFIKVKDDGHGISIKDRKILFQPFCKSARDAANSAPGVGLGLSLCLRLAKNMKCNIEIDKNVKKGACFVLTIPVFRL